MWSTCELVKLLYLYYFFKYIILISKLHRFFVFDYSQQFVL